MPDGHPTRAGIIASALVAAVSFVAACEPAEEPRGQLVITFQTDMALPTQIDNVNVQLTRRGGNVLLMQPYSIGGAAQDNPIPGSLVLVAGDQPEPITITVAGSKKDSWRTYREIVTTVPRNRVAELRMPIQWLCNESAEPQVETVADGKGGQVSRIIQALCEDGYTCKAGACVSSETDSASLPDFDPRQLYGGAEKPENGTCFDVVECMASGTTTEPDADCTIERPVGENINVALRVAGGGICNDSPPVTTCFVPLDGEDPEGWMPTADGLRIQLPEEVCIRLADRKVLAVQTSTLCQTKRPSSPPCGAWSVVPRDNAIIPIPDPAQPAPTWPSPELFVSLPADGAKLCCPLMSEGNQLYTCMCTEGKEEAAVYAVDMQSARRQTFTINKRPTMAASVSNQTLFWATDTSVFVFPLQDGATPGSFKGKGSHYPNVLLTDASGVHVLTSGLGDMLQDPVGVVQLLHFAPNGTFLSMDPLGNSVVRQFAQDASAFYAAKNVDEKRPEGQPFQRVSSVVRIDKQSHQVSTLLNPQTLTLTDLYRNGFLGVVSDGADVFALFESEPVADLEHLQIARITGASTAAPSELVPIYDLPVSAAEHLTSLRLLGAVDGAVFFAREEWASQDRLRSSSVLVIPRGSSSARFIADFSGDLPAPGMIASGDQIFWLNQSGRIFALSHEALAP